MASNVETRMETSRPEEVIREDEQTISMLCSVCFGNFSDDSRMVTTTCNHDFHYHCLQTWQHRNSTCPVCKQHLLIASDTTHLAGMFMTDLSSAMSCNGFKGKHQFAVPAAMRAKIYKSILSFSDTVAQQKYIRQLGEANHPYALIDSQLRRINEFPPYDIHTVQTMAAALQLNIPHDFVLPNYYHAPCIANYNSNVKANILETGELYSLDEAWHIANGFFKTKNIQPTYIAKQIALRILEKHPNFVGKYDWFLCFKCRSRCFPRFAECNEHKALCRQVRNKF